MYRTAVAGAALVVAALLGPGAVAPAAPGTEATTTGQVARDASAALAALPVKGRAPKTGYTRSAFGQAWADVDRNGCDTRNDILRRDLRPVVVASNRCTVRSGRFTDPYSGTAVTFRADGSVEIDHVVALADAWVKGAQRLTPARRTTLANDPLNLVTTTAAVNQRKGSGDAATWLPPDRHVRCAYVARQIAVKRTYGLWVTAAEAAAMARVLATCPGQPLPTAEDVAVPAISPAPSPGPTSRPESTDPRYGTCRAAKAAGYGPYRRGVDPEYAWYRDADGDGVVCE